MTTPFWSKTTTVSDGVVLVDLEQGAILAATGDPAPEHAAVMGSSIYVACKELIFELARADLTVLRNFTGPGRSLALVVAPIPGR